MTAAGCGDWPVGTPDGGHPYWVVGCGSGAHHSTREAMITGIALIDPSHLSEKFGLRIALARGMFCEVDDEIRVRADERHRSH